MYITAHVMNHAFCIIGMHTHVCTVPTTLLTLRWCRSSCCSNIQQCLALETHSAMHGECKQTKTAETTQHTYTCAFSYVHTYIQQFLCGTYIWIQPFSTAIRLSAHMYCTYVHHLRLTCWQLAVQTCSFVPSKSKAHDISLSYNCTARCYYMYCTCMELHYNALCAYECDTIKE